MDKNYVFTHTPGHGFLKVPKSDVLQLMQLGHRIEPTGSFYDRGEYVEFEEDCDAPEFLAAAKAEGWKVKIEEFILNSIDEEIRLYPRP